MVCGIIMGLILRLHIFLAFVKNPQSIMDYDDFEHCYVIDNGGRWIKSGEAGDDAPRGMTPTLIGHGNTFKSPIQNGIITNNDDMELLWNHVFENELRLDTTQWPILLTAPTHNPISNTENMIEIMFETFDVPATYIGMFRLLFFNLMFQNLMH